LAVNVYEGMFILDSNRYGRDAEGVSGQIPDMIQKAGGEILVSRLWEERRLAYQINGHRKGTYWLTYFRLDGDRLAKMQRQCRLSESILRVLFVKVDPRIADALVAHAQVGPAAANRNEKKAETDKVGKEAETAPDAEAANDAVAVAEPKESSSPETDNKDES